MTNVLEKKNLIFIHFPYMLCAIIVLLMFYSVVTTLKFNLICKTQDLNFQLV
jgi:hypothetical protein